MSDQIKPLFTWRSAICESDLGSATRHVALTLALYMNERGGSAHPGPARLARETGLNISTVKEKLRELEKMGWLRCVERGGLVGAKRRANEYEAVMPPAMLFLHNPAPMAPGARDHRSSCLSAPGAMGDPMSSRNSSNGSRARAIPDPFEVTPEMIEWVQENHPAVNWNDETKKFLDHFRANGKPMKDWGATWRNWIRRSVDFAR